MITLIIKKQRKQRESTGFKVPQIPFFDYFSSLFTVDNLNYMKNKDPLYFKQRVKSNQRVTTIDFFYFLFGNLPKPQNYFNTLE